MKEFYRNMRMNNRTKIGWMIVLAGGIVGAAAGRSLWEVLISATAAAAYRALKYRDLDSFCDAKPKKKMLRFGPDTLFFDIMRANSFPVGEYYLLQYMGMLPGLILAAAGTVLCAFITEQPAWYIVTAAVMFFLVPFIVLALHCASAAYCLRHEPSSVSLLAQLSSMAVFALLAVSVIRFSIDLAYCPETIRHTIFGIHRGNPAIINWDNVQWLNFVYVIPVAIIIGKILVDGVSIWKTAALLILTVYLIHNLPSMQYTYISGDTMKKKDSEGVVSEYNLISDAERCKVRYVWETGNGDEQISINVVFRDGKDITLSLKNRRRLFLDNSEFNDEWYRQYGSSYPVYLSDLLERLDSAGVACEFIETCLDRGKYADGERLDELAETIKKERERVLKSWNEQNREAYRRLLEFVKPKTDRK